MTHKFSLWIVLVCLAGCASQSMDTRLIEIARDPNGVLIEHGFRLPSAFDNRPLKFVEFDRLINQVVYVSATPKEEELGKSQQVAE